MAANLSEIVASYRNSVTAPLNIVDVLRARDGDRCWLCNQLIQFDAKPNSPQAWSVEHLIAKSRGGFNQPDNLVLCHPGCNRMLGCRPLKDKIKLRERRRRKLWLATIRPQLLAWLRKSRRD